MDRAQSAIEVANFSRFLDWQKGVAEEYHRIFRSRRFFQRFPDPPCDCAVSDDEYFSACGKHQKEFGFSLQNFLNLGLGKKYLTNKLSSEEGRRELEEKVFREQRIHLKAGITLVETERLAKENFIGVPLDEIKIVWGSQLYYDEDGITCKNDWCYLTAKK